jgi:P27 family predicted phage terminase small subunit
MGRPALSNELHDLRGTKPQSKIATESHVRAGRPKFPLDIRHDPELRATFKKICKLLLERRALSTGDVELIRLYCFAFDRHKRQVELLRNEGELVEVEVLDSNGQAHMRKKENPRLKIVVGAEKEMAAILSQLGMSPTAKDRARPTSGTPVEKEIPGSLGDLMPELFDGKVRSIRPEGQTNGDE